MSQKIIILGGGESGVGAARLAKAKGFEVFLSDKGKLGDKYKQELLAHQIDFEEEQHSESKILEADEIIKSPGIPQTTPLMLKVREKGIKVSSEIDFASRYTNAKIIAITGTNGKTTTTLLTYHLLKNAGLNVGLAGNIGESFARMVLEKSFDYYVLEISSFQLEDIHTFHPNIGLLLNITPDHLDRYAYKMENYVAAKFRLIDNMKKDDFFIYNADDEYIVEFLKNKSFQGNSLSFSAGFFENEELKITVPKLSSNPLVFNRLPLRGKHNGMNMSAAILASLSLNISPEIIQESLPSFKNAAHRLEEVASVNGVLFVNDSKATNVDSVKYALDSYQRPLIWIAGGIDKGNDYQLIMDLVKKNVKAMVCLGTNNEPLQKAFSPLFGTLPETQNVTDAIKKAFEMAQKGDIVLLSPACASFDLFKNYEDRGNQFRIAAQKFEKEWKEKHSSQR
ncbi:MAG: UDP-N-acetylmuramoyl-L-alanine--D-glutamate ligase [Flammeovirgaceae bacterium]